MDETLQNVVTLLQSRYSAEYSQFRGETRIILDGAHISEALLSLRDEYGFDLLAFLTAVDYWPEEEPRFHVIYQVYSTVNNVYIRLYVPVSGSEPSLPSVESIYPNANWHERETFDMFGIRFEGHSDMRRILMPFDWEGYPLRKDYPLGYEEVQFSFNFDEIQKRKPKPKE